MTQEMKFDLLPSDDVDPTKPLIYLWEIHTATGELAGRYVGKAEGGDKRPTKHYRRNVNKLLAGRLYKQGKSYRRIHHALADAAKAGHKITLRYLQNVGPEENIFDVEMDHIKKLGCLAIDGGIGLNGIGIHPLPDTSKPRLPPAGGTRQRTAFGSANLDALVRSVQAAYPSLRDEPGSRRIAFFLGDYRILRAAQSGPRAKVQLKLAVSARLDGSKRELPWDGTEQQLRQLIDAELYRHEHEEHLARQK